MQDMTTGPVTRHLLKTTSFMLVTMIFQTLYFLIDLYWVGRLGPSAVAAVGIAGNLSFIVLALTQMIGVGTTAVVSHAVGRKDHDQALVLFNQSQVLAMVTGVLFLLVGLAFEKTYSAAMSADAATATLAGDYLLWFIPAMALQFALVAMGSALRAVGNFKPGMMVSTATVIINMILAPFLIFGWGNRSRVWRRRRGNVVADRNRGRRRLAHDVFSAQGFVPEIRRRRLEATIRSMVEDACDRSSRRLRVRHHRGISVRRVLRHATIRALRRRRDLESVYV